MLPFTVLEGQSVLPMQKYPSCISFWAGCPALEMHMVRDFLCLYSELGDSDSAGMCTEFQHRLNVAGMSPP